MANTPVGYTEGTGKNIAADLIAGATHQAVKIETGVEGSASYVSTASPMPVTIDTGILISILQELTIVLNRMLSGAGQQMPDPAGRTRVTVDNWAATLSAVGRLNTAGITSLDIGPAYISMNNLPALLLRDRITNS